MPGDPTRDRPADSLFGEVSPSPVAAPADRTAAPSLAVREGRPVTPGPGAVWEGGPVTPGPVAVSAGRP
ncbi:hypothetical protein GCM10010216_32990 [Streptomyces flaveolus]|nr:hypothetical protein GCM10010216_32990 [Streptomyces flaveolus]